MAHKTDGRKMRTIRATDAEHRTWVEAARATGKDWSAWARDLMDEAAAGRLGGVQPPKDPEFEQDMMGLAEAYGIADPAQVVRMCVTAAARRMRHGLEPFRILDPPDVIIESRPPKRR